MMKNRQEILYLYDVTDANPNGDPLDENKPRIDEETGTNIVTDVRLKRTVRDYLYNFKGYNGDGDKDIFVRETLSEKGTGIKDGKARAKTFKESSENVINQCIDVRLFGAVIPLDKSSITYTGPVQFNMGRSLNKVKVNHIKGTGAFASGDGKLQATFREEYLINYSLIAFHGLINENAAKYTNLSNEDVELLLESMWNGTKNLITRSKMGHMPRILVNIKYKEGSPYFIGDLQRRVKISSELHDEKIRSIEDFKLDITNLLDKIEENEKKIESVKFIYDRDITFIRNGENINVEEVLKAMNVIFEVGYEA